MNTLTFVAFSCAIAVAAATAPASPRALPITVTPAATGRQMVRASLPLPPGMLRAGETLVGAGRGVRVEPAVRVLTWYPARSGAPRSARRAIVTFPFTFHSRRPVKLTLRAAPKPARATGRFPLSVTLSAGEVVVSGRGRPTITARLMAPRRTSSEAPRLETVERSRYYLWQRLHVPDPHWPRVIEVRADALGQVLLIARLQRNLTPDGCAPDLGWQMTVGPVRGRAVIPGVGSVGSTLGIETGTVGYVDGKPREVSFNDGAYALSQPLAHLQMRGSLGIDSRDHKLLARAMAYDAAERVPMQQASWRTAEVEIGPSSLARLTPALTSPHRVDVPPAVWRDLYDLGDPLDLSHDPELRALLAYHHDAIVRSMAVGDDLGNVTSYSDSAPHGSAFGMNRLNHCPAIFEEGWRSGDRRLIDTALMWCNNFYNQSIWWGPGDTGGTRYNNLLAMNRTPPDNDRHYMWRSDSSVSFCTKGYDSFFLAWEETGDPRMKQALDAQVAYASRSIHANEGECRNIGDVRDFVSLYRWTGEHRYLEQALRLFRELRTKLSPGDLFDQGGKPLTANLPFIEDDDQGYHYGYAKPYIIGYALAGLPELAPLAPHEQRLRDTVRAVADFLASSEDPLGGWRYPHPRSTGLILCQAIEHAWQIVQAARLIGPEPRYLDAIERVLRQRVQGWLRTGECFGGLTGWEYTTGKAKTPADIVAMYAHPQDRDASRDYTEGALGFGYAPPEGLVYFPEVLAYYLQHRPASRLLAPPAPGSPLATVLARVPERKAADPKGPHAMYETPGVDRNLPAFYKKLAARLTYPMSWLSGRYRDFAAWKRIARAKVRQCLLTPPPIAPFAPHVVAEEDRGTYIARKITLQLTGDSRVLAYLLMPKAPGKHPAALLLHDHGARFDIGKEKVIEPFDVPAEKLRSARQWADEEYGGLFIGDELAKRGYVCFATDMLNWSDRGGGGFEGQQALASTMFQLGVSWSGLIAYEDLRALDYFAGLPDVDRARIAAVGLSVGAYRTWQIAALSDKVAAGVAVCWMATDKGLMVPGNNQTTGQSAFTMIHPGLRRYLDYPDVASIACPKPMLFYGGEQDGLFPVASVKAAFAKMHRVWQSQHAGDRLETRFWNVPHVFNREMQDAAFAWLDRQLYVSPGR